MVTLFFIVTFIGITFAAENAYQSLNIPLPMSLAGHISAVYNSELYVFGGANASIQGSMVPLQNKFWKLPLSKISLLGTTDINSDLTSSDWEELDVAAPSYGESTTNEFYCEGQCSAIIGKYLYIVGPYSSSSSSLYDYRDTIYRLDLSADPPVFSAQSAFTSSIGYTNDATQHCVTAADDILYILTGGWGQTYSVEGLKYDPSTSTNSQDSLAAMPLTNTYYGAGRQKAGCAGDIKGDAIYLFGGKSKTFTYGAPGVDTYDVTDDAWTENSASVEFDLDNGANGANSRRQIKCFNKYTRAVECVGGFGITGGNAAALNNAIIWSYEDKSEEYVSLSVGTVSAAVGIYEIMNDGSNAANIVLVTGGYTTVNFDTPTDVIQYAVRYVTITNDPTKSPVPSPSVNPTPAPSRSPLCDGCSHPPSEAPTTETPTAAPVSSDGFVVKLWSVVAFMVIMVSAVVYV